LSIRSFLQQTQGVILTGFGLQKLITTSVCYSTLMIRSYL